MENNEIDYVLRGIAEEMDRDLAEGLSQYIPDDIGDDIGVEKRGVNKRSWPKYLPLIRIEELYVDITTSYGPIHCIYTTYKLAGLREFGRTKRSFPGIFKGLDERKISVNNPIPELARDMYHRLIEEGQQFESEGERDRIVCQYLKEFIRIDYISDMFLLNERLKMLRRDVTRERMKFRVMKEMD